VADEASKSSSMAVDNASTYSQELQLPPPLVVRPRDASSPTIRVVPVQDKALPPLPPAASVSPPGSRSPAARLSAGPSQGLPQGWTDLREGSGSAERSNSTSSSLWDSIPAWARYSSYFPRISSSQPVKPTGRRQPNTTVSSQQSASRNTNLNLNPRAYYAQEARNVQRPDSLTIPVSPHAPIITDPQAPARGRPGADARYTVTNPTALVPAEARRLAKLRGVRPPGSPADWSPHLWRDRRSAAQRRTIYKAPSLDEAAEATTLNRRNVQIWLFVLGFIFPPGQFPHPHPAPDRIG
jgi:hypothetical protein